jgi:Pentapeptide repeats (8 copies)
MPIPSRDRRRELLRADCGNCFGLCCVALSFARSADFAFDKPAGDACVNLQPDFSCGIHQRLRTDGFKGCTVFDCSGAGQKVAQSTFRGVSWVDDPESREQMFSVFPIMRDLHELLWYLSEALERAETSHLVRELARGYTSTVDLTELSADDLLALDVNVHRVMIVELLARASEQVRSQVVSPWQKSRATRDVGPRADLMGRVLADTNLRGAPLRGAYLIAADLRGSDFTAADLIGADLRDAQLAGADLSQALFLTQQQVNSAHGDSSTRLPESLERPAHWA